MLGVPACRPVRGFVHRVVVLALWALHIPACSRPQSRAASADSVEVNSIRAQPGIPQPAGTGANPARSDTLPPRIYYNLTRFEWYARGEPLQFEGREYVQSGAPLPLSASALLRVGEYAGVDLYARAEGDSVRMHVYIPVFEGFWLGFVRADSGTTSQR
jgi:hypothetical protein